MKYFKKRLQQEFIRADRYKKFLSIIMIDLDYFKKVNDCYDHLLGSYVLAETGHLLRHSVRNLDIAARFGGDEYVIMLPETDPEGAWSMAERIRSQLEKKIFDNQIHRVQITSSVGVSTMGPTDCLPFQDANELIRKADQFLYEAKETGRNQVIDLDHSNRQSFDLSLDPHDEVS